jgi:hypothetical protein
MTDTAWPLPLETRAVPVPKTKILAVAVQTWFVLAAVGHWIFLAYILGALFPPLAQEGLRGLDTLKLTGGFVAGDTLGNLAVASHVLLAAVIIGGGPLQLIPGIRRHFPRFHHWLGRTYLLAALTSSVAGLYMVLTRGTVGNLVTHLGIALDAVLIVVFGVMALRYAISREIRTHRRWALRLFMAASAVWFYRVGLMAWMMLTGGAGIDFETFTGPVPAVMAFAQYLLPLAMLEWYFRCQDQPTRRGQLLFASTLGALTLFMGVGIFAATMGLWLPRM